MSSSEVPDLMNRVCVSELYGGSACENGMNVILPVVFITKYT